VSIGKLELKKILITAGISVNGNKVSRLDFRKVFGAKYSEPEWFVQIENKSEILNEYLPFITSDEEKLNRVILDSSYSFTKYGDYTTNAGNVYPLVGIVYQYSLFTNPRNVHYAYRLFYGPKNLFKNSGFPSLQEAKNECSSEAKNLIETQLFV